MAFDKLSICNSALIRTGNNPAAYEGDGSDEWTSASDAYDTMLPVMVQHHDWGFATSIATLNRQGDSVHPDWDDAYYKPAGCLHPQCVWLDDYEAPYQIVDNLILLSASGMTPTCQFVRQPSADQWPDTFVETLRMFIMAACYRGLNEDPREADNLYDRAMKQMAMAASRVSQEQGSRARFRSRLLAARRTSRLGWFDPYLDRAR